MTGHFSLSFYGLFQKPNFPWYATTETLRVIALYLMNLAMACLIHRYLRLFRSATNMVVI